MELSRVFKKILCDTKHPVMAWCDQSGAIVETLSGPNIWTLSYERFTELKKQGARPGDRLFSQAGGKRFVIDLFASLIGHFVFVPCDTDRRDFVSYKDRELLYQCGVALELKTSGTTGSPKTCYYTRQGLLLQLQSHAEYFNYPAESERLCILPWGHAFGLVLDLMLGLFSKSVMFCPLNEKFRGSRKWIVNMLNSHEIDHVALVPRQLELMLLDKRLYPRAPKLIYVGGAKLSPSLLTRTKNWLGFSKIVEGYGLTEAGPGVLLNGQPVGCETKIQEGVLFVKSKSWCLDENFNEPDEWMPTNDFCHLTEERLIRVLCRSSQRIKSTAGLWVNLALIEEHIAKFLDARSVSIKPQAEGLGVVVFVDQQLGEEQRIWITEHLLKYTGQGSIIREIVLNEQTEKFLESSRGKDLSHFFESQELM